MRALILVDIQNDFMPTGALPVPDGDAVVHVANAISGGFELVVATQDWHPAEHESFAANHEGRAPGEVIDLYGLDQILWPVHCVQGSSGAEFVEGLDTRPVAAVFRKGMDPTIDSYSGFFDNGRKRATGLTGYLRALGVEQVYVMGVATDYCVKFTALDAVDEGFETFLVQDGCRGVGIGPTDIDDAVAMMRERGVRVIDSSEVTPRDA